jgi:methyl-accepting chemotaxis protein
MARAARVVLYILWLVLVPSGMVKAAGAEETFAIDAPVALDAYRAAAEGRLEEILVATRVLAATEEVRSGDWQRMRRPLAILAANQQAHAAVWFARPDGSYFTVEKGLTGESLRDRAYFQRLLVGGDVVGELVISKSTGRRSIIVASPVMVHGRFVGAIGVSVDATRFAVAIDQAIRFPANVVFYALDAQGRTALHRAGDLIFAFPSDMGSPTLKDAVATMLSQPRGVVQYVYSGARKTAVFEHSAFTDWVFVLGQASP